VGPNLPNLAMSHERVDRAQSLKPRQTMLGRPQASRLVEWYGLSSTVVGAWHRYVVWRSPRPFPWDRFRDKVENPRLAFPQARSLYLPLEQEREV
jgi:hypothetical protein